MPAVSLAISPSAAIVTHAGAAPHGNGHDSSSNGYASEPDNQPGEYYNGNEPIKTKIIDTPCSTSASPIKARILVQVEGEIVNEYALNQTFCTIGRFPTSDIQIPSERVSRFHATIRWKNGAWIIEDAESLNGLICQGQRIDQLALVDGDRVFLDAGIMLQYEEQ